ncbi:MAG: hypothetical protein ABI890_02710, partial [Lapillicoccus sp.]
RPSIDRVPPSTDGPALTDGPHESATANERTLAAYEAHAQTYRDQTAGPVRPACQTFLAELAAGAPAGLILEIGSADGRDALVLEGLGRRVRRTDATRAFVDLLRLDGHEADVLNVLTDDLGGPYAGVLADAVLLHFTPAQLGSVLDRVRESLSPGGLLAFSVKVGDGSEWSEHKLGAPRFFHYWQEAPLRALLRNHAFHVVDVTTDVGGTWDWLLVIATTADATPRGDAT